MLLPPEWGNSEAGFGVLWRTLAWSLALLVVAGLAGALLRGIVRWLAGQIKSAEHQTWPAALASAARKPAALVIWVYGACLALSPVMREAATDERMLPIITWFRNLAQVGGLIALFWFLFRVILVIEKRLRAAAEKTSSIWDNLLVSLAGAGLRMLIPVVALFLIIPLLGLPVELAALANKLAGILLIMGIAWLIARATFLAETAILSRNRLDTDDNLVARRIYTQVSVIRKIVVFLTTILAVASSLMLFDPVRQLGTSILASAGIAGIILGFAAQKTLGNLFAGIQIALSQPIRIDDVVIVEGEFGRIEEITLTYVVVRLWDLRRMVLPITYFVEKPFQNWTRTSANLLGTVFLYVDYQTDFDAVRTELRRIVEANPLWDRNVCGLQVTNVSERTVELRALASAADAGKAFNLRCEIREKLLTFLRENYPESLPRVRADWPPLPVPEEFA